MKILGFLVICILLIAIVSTASAESDAAQKVGFYGDIRIGGGVISSRPSGLDAFDDNERLDSLDASGKRQSVGLPLIGGEVGYIFDNSGTKLFAGADIGKPFYLSVSRELTGVGNLSFSALYEKTDVWENPYLVGVNRSKTDAESVGYGLNLDNVLDTGIRLFFDQKFINVAQDRIGHIQPDLRRDGTDTTLGIGFSMDWGAGGVMSPSLRHIWIDRDGTSNSGCGYAAEITHTLFKRRLSFATSLKISRIDYDKLHPIFNKKREENAYGVLETIAFAAPFGIDNLYLFGIAAYGKTNANIIFFNSSSVALGGGVGYKF